MTVKIVAVGSSPQSCGLSADVKTGEATLVLWGDRLMRRGKCPRGEECLACQRLGYHLEDWE